MNQEDLEAIESIKVALLDIWQELPTSKQRYAAAALAGLLAGGTTLTDVELANKCHAIARAMVDCDT